MQVALLLSRGVIVVRFRCQNTVAMDDHMFSEIEVQPNIMALSCTLTQKKLSFISNLIILEICVMDNKMGNIE